MNAMTRFFLASTAALVVALPAAAQVGKNASGILDPNLATKEQLVTVPHVTAAIAESIIKGRPYLDMLALDKVVAPALPEAQRKETYAKLFIPINLNTATRAEILLVPGVGATNGARVRGVPAVQGARAVPPRDRQVRGRRTKLARLEQYVFVPINLNTATDADFLTIPGLGNRCCTSSRSTGRTRTSSSSGARSGST